MLNELQSVDNNVTKVGEVQSRTLRPERRRGRGGARQGLESPSLLSKYTCWGFETPVGRAEHTRLRVRRCAVWSKAALR